MALPDDLLEQALHLATREPNRPRQASLRRSVSTAYYALFHLLIADAVKNWKRAPDRPQLARLFDHGPMKEACTAKCKELGQSHRRVDIHVYAVAKTFLEMQEHRHRADYDNATVWRRTDVLQKVGIVKTAFNSWRAVRKNPEAQQFLASLLLRRRR